jgi:hypothetical protein
LRRDVAAAYQAADDAVRQRDHAEARRQLTIAVGLMPDFTEGWYILGGCAGRLAIEAAGRDDDQAALALFREGEDAKKRAAALVREGKWFVYGPEEQAHAREDLADTPGEANGLLANDEVLLIALKRAAGKGQ